MNYCDIMIRFLACILFFTNYLAGQISIDSLISDALSHKEDTMKIIMLTRVADGLQSNNPSLSDSLNQVTLNFSKRINYDKGINYSLVNIISLHLLQGEYDLAEDKIRELLTYAKEQNDEHALIRALNRLAVVHYYQGEYQKGIQTNLEVLDIISDQPEHKSRLYALNNIGINYEQLEDYDKALEYYEQALQEANNVENVYAGGAIAGNMGVIYTSLNQLEKAKELVQTSIAAAHKLNNQNLLVDMTYNLGEIYIKENSYSQALVINQESLNAARSVNDNNGVLKAMSQKGRIDFFKGDYSSAVKSLEESLALSEEIGDKENIIELYDFLNRSYLNQGKMHEAYEYLNLYSSAKDTVFNIEKTNEISKLEIQYQVAEKERALLENQIEIERKTAQRNRFLLATISLIIIAASIFYIMRFRIRKNRVLAQQKTLIQSQRIKELEKEKKILSMAAMIDGQESERIRIAKDLHDGLGGLLATVRTQMSKVEMEITKLQDIKLYEKTNQMIDQACTEVRRISQNLMPSILRLEGLGGAVEDIIIQLEEVHGVVVNKSINISTADLTETQEMFIYRIIQELINNVVKHAQASEVMIQLNDYSDHLNIIIEDNGKGYSLEKVDQERGIGLKSVQSRVDHLNGELEIIAEPDEGTSVSINIPYKL